MKRSSPYFGLKWAVEVKWPHNPYYEVIAAFNVDRVATNYAWECYQNQSKPKLEYRVRERTGKGWKVIYEAQ